MTANILTPCIVPDCPGRNWTDGRREACPECVAREKRIKAMVKRLRKASHPALGRLREVRVVVER